MFLIVGAEIRILNIHWSEHVPKWEIRLKTQQPLLSDVVQSRRLRFFGHVYEEPTPSTTNIVLYGPAYLAAKGLEEETWPSKTDVAIRTVEKNVSPLTSARLPQNPSPWRSLVETAASLTCPG